MKDHVRSPGWPRIFSLAVLAVVVSFTSPPILLAAAPNVVINRGIHFSMLNGNPVTLSPGKYLVEQAGPQELRLTAVADKKEFLIQAKALTHEQYELFSPMALTRYSKNHEFLINLFLPGGIRLEATGSSKEIPKPIPGQGPPPIQPIVEFPAPPLNPPPQDKTPEVVAMEPDPEPPVLPQTTPIPGQGPPPMRPLIEPTAPPLNPPPQDKTPEVVAMEPDPEPPVLPQTTPILDPPPPLPVIEEPTLLTYQAPAPDQPGLRIDGKSSDTQYPSVFVLAPNHVGRTSQEHPVLYWYLSQSTQSPLDVMIAEEGNLDVLLDIRLLPPLQAGIHELRLEDYGISLLPDVPYRWTVRMITSTISESPTASGAIQRIQAPAGSSTSLLYSPEGYAQKGQWYDAITALQTLIQDKPRNTDLLAQRASLLEQVGLTEAAAFGQQYNTP